MKKIKLEQKNLKINSDNWEKHTNKNGQKYLENPTGDVWEYKGNQYFTWDGAMREAEKLGKRLATNEEMEELEKEDYGEVRYAGYRCILDGLFYVYEGDGITAFWSSTETADRVYTLFLNPSKTFTYWLNEDKMNGFSVRCVQE